MWTNPEEARSDFVLAAATALFAPLVFLLIRGVLPFLTTGLLGLAVNVALVFAAYGLVPLLLARYRGDGASAFGLDGPRRGTAPGLLLAVPIVFVGVVYQWSQPTAVLDGQPVRDQWLALLGNLAVLPGGATASVLTLLGFVAAFAGAVLLYTFLAVKARDGFAQNDIGQLQALRTFGMGAAIGALVVGMLGTLAGRVSIARALLDAGALMAVVLIADRLVQPGARTTRATVLAPAIVALIIGIELFSGNFLTTLRVALLGAGTVIVAAVLVETRRYAWAVVPLFAALILYPTGLRPV
ncbi:MAG: hypothetical protein KY462_01120 [Actinobacteria bacterium]|nr:hypothetical protein [Actinomycetota bacterium]